MRGPGDLNKRITLYGRDPTDNDRDILLGSVWAYRRDSSGKEFLGGAAVQAESTVIYTIRRPRTWRLDSGVTIEDKQGNRYDVLAITDNPVFPGFIDLRAITRKMEGIGYAAY